MTPNNSTSAARHNDRAQEQIAHEAAKWIQHEASTQSLITVTRVALTMRGTRATIYVSIFPENQIRTALAFLARERGNFALHLREHARIRPIPMVEFLLDDGTAPIPHLDDLAKKP
jgi:ribosome-binding factor A